MGALRSVGAVLAGLVTLYVLVKGLDAAMYAFDPGAFHAQAGGMRIPVGWAIVSFVGGLMFAIAGGYVTARLANRSELKHIVALMVVALPLNVVSIATREAGTPLWLHPLEGLVGLTGFLLGGLIRVGTKTARLAGVQPK